MAVPDFQAFMRPILHLIQDGQEHRIRDLYEPLARHFSLTKEDVQELLPSGRQAKYANRILWAKFHLSKAGAVSSPSRGTVRMTEQGGRLLQQYPGSISMRELSTIPAYAQFVGRGKAADLPAEAQLTSIPPTTSPEEQLDALYTELNAALADDLLAQVTQLTPQQFEALVVQLLVAMGYGGTTRDAGQALGKSGDNGIDGLVKQDPLGLDKVYLQAKKWQNTVHSPEIRTFAGSLSYHKASKGVFLTTSGFSNGARETAERLGHIILIDGPRLAELMIQYGVGVVTHTTYALKRVDSEFFEGV
ncbi:restriction endonuclease [Deinococcus aestuarii]|uniref:restriction endonuclease n=1 Tax=Deinococcus aestuarii TaxID=2774531 RepID=UPI001C0C36B0|nr:restriction endonuclease [Deinococcus aestuarii]